MFRSFVIVFCFIICRYAAPVAAQENYFHLHIPEDTQQVALLLKKAKATEADSAVKLIQKALAISRRTKNHRGTANALLDYGARLFDQKEYLSSKAAFTEAAPYCYLASSEDKSLLPRLYDDMANVLLMQGRLDSAIPFYYRALAELKKSGLKDTSLLMLIYANAGAALAFNHQSRQGLYYLKTSVLLALQIKDSLILAQNYENIGVAFENLRKGDSALFYYTQALQLHQLQQLRKRQQQTYYLMGITTGREGNLQLAKHYFDSAFAADPKGGIQNAALQKAFGDVYKEWGNYSKAISYYKKSLETAVSKGVLGMEPTIYKALAESYSQTGNKALAYQFQKYYSDLKDSLMNAEKIETLNQLEVKYRTAQMDKEITAKKLLITRQQKKLLQKNFWIGGISVGTLLLIFLFITLYRNYRHKQKLQSAALANLKQKQRINHLHALMQGEENERNRIARELHDGIGSILAAARMHLDIFKDPEQIPAYAATYKNGINLLDEAYRDLRYTAHNLLPPEQLLENGLVAATASYCRKISKSGSFNIHFQRYGPEPKMPATVALSFYRIIQELIHNAAKHAEATEVIVEIGVEEQQLFINVEDNGKGWKIAEDIEEGIGMRNLRQRVETLGGSIEIDSRPEIGTTIYLTFDLSKIIKNES